MRGRQLARARCRFARIEQPPCRSSPRKRNTPRTSLGTQSSGETLRTVSAALGQSLAGESAEWGRIRDERIETERQRRLDMSRDRGFSM